MQAGKACAATLTASSEGERLVLFLFLLQAQLFLNLLPVTGNSAHRQYLCQSFAALLGQLGSLLNIAQRITLSQIFQRRFSVYQAVGWQIACLIFHMFFGIQLGRKPQLRTHPAPGCRLAQLQHLFYRLTGKICIQAGCVHIAIAMTDIQQAQHIRVTISICGLQLFRSLCIGKLRPAHTRRHRRTLAVLGRRQHHFAFLRRCRLSSEDSGSCHVANKKHAHECRD